MTTAAESATQPRPKVYVHLLPSLIPPGSLAGGVAVVVDVLRATTVMVHALANGAEAVIPCAEIEEAKAVAGRLPRGTAILGGERGGLPIDGFDLGNSPDDYNREVCAGKTLVMTTTNGTRAILASQDAERVCIASFANLKATARELAVQFRKRDHGHPIHIVCSGTEGFISLEDTLLASELLAAIPQWTGATGAEAGNDEAIIVSSLAMGAAQHLPGNPLPEVLKLGRGGQNVTRIGLEKDIKTAAEVDRLPIVAELARDPLRIVKV